MVKRHYGIVTKEYKLVHYYYDIDEWEFLDRKADPNEMTNLYYDPKYQSIIQTLKKKLKKFVKNIKTQMNYLKNIYIKKHSFFILLFLSFSGVSLGQIAKKTKVFILAGQSNMDGRGDASKLSETEMKLLSNASQKIYFVYKGTVGEGNAIQYKGALDFTNPWSFVKKIQN